MEKVTTEYLRGFEECVTSFDEQLARSTANWLTSSVDLHKAITAWNEIALHVSWLKLQVLNMKDDTSEADNAVHLSLVKKEEN